MPGGKLTVAIIGRPNVGKSTLFNRLVGKRLALVDDTPGVTRDRREGDARLGDLKFSIVDTAGLDEAEAESLAGRMRAQTEAAIASADLSLFVIDARAGVTPLDAHFAGLLRKVGRPVVLVANKAEGRIGEAGALEAYSLGFGEPVAISAEHGDGMAELYDALRPFADEASRLAEVERDRLAREEAALAAERAGDEAGDAPSDIEGGAVDEEVAPEEEDDPDRPLNVAIVGRPNVGKSTLVNRLIGEDRMLTGPEAGITRDAISVDWEAKGRRFRLVDTAGLRRKARVEEKLEKLSVADTIRALRYAEVVVLMIDASQPFEKQDLQIADLVEREGRAIVLAVSKWDAAEDRQALLKKLRDAAERLLPQLKGVQLVPVSGLTGEGLDKLLNAVIAAHKVWNRRISTSRLNRWLERTLDNHPPPAVSGRRLRLRYMTQAKARPPTFVAFATRPDALPDSYVRYLVNDLRTSFDLPGTPIRLMLRQGENPYAGKKS
jgi:GTP-binding protein